MAAFQVPTTPNGDALLWKIGAWLIAAATGWLGAVITSRVQFRDVVAELEAIKTDFARTVEAMNRAIEQRHESSRAEIGRLRRQQIIMLEALANIANKVGVDNRFSDSLLRMIAIAAQEEDA